jgi:hypothetical protein
MITITRLNKHLVSFSTNLRGIKMINNSFESSDISEEIESVIKANFDSVLRLNVESEIEDYQDIRTLKQCAILKNEMLIVFKISPSDEDLAIIKNYLNKFFIKADFLKSSTYLY